MEEERDSVSSSIDSSSQTSVSTAASFARIRRRDFAADLRLGLSLSSSSSEDSPKYLRNNLPNWPPIKSVIRSSITERGSHRNNQKKGSFFVKVYMEGIPIGRKLDLLTHDCYQSLIKSLQRMFRTSIICPDDPQLPSTNSYVLTYEDKEGDWMMVGDVSWEFFLTTVTKLKIIRADKC